MQIKTKLAKTLPAPQRATSANQFIEVCLDSSLYAKTSLYLRKHFPEHVRFKHTLILLEKAGLKKAYLLNRLFYAKYALHPFNSPDMFNLLLEKILSNAHLPVVFKESYTSKIKSKSLLALVPKVEIQAIYMHSRLVFYYTHFLAREFLHSVFAPFILLETPFKDKSNKKSFLHETHAHLDALQVLMSLKNPHFKHAYIQFIYPTQKLFLTKQEELILKALRTLGLGVMHSKEEIKRRYLELAKLYHPDTAPSKKPHHNIRRQRFLEVTEAYKVLKNL
ncbi:J domain-containing protein [Helicobacter sp. NHP19-012]|uniref:J domain-containing protein n=1 Tax=Helicobacter gastrofelis TaxID=2849642 RepID=A0ABM7SLQ4_9HELI|nr:MULTISPECIES: J domain-containing protein [unclassified Helicobacter]BCZ19051.1 J domain-containing protein [Helicobacter sp. NHP19-012]GMB96598.1 J domain-containing protein [Helicobacter sp. NHP22-001]